MKQWLANLLWRLGSKLLYVSSRLSGRRLMIKRDQPVARKQL